MRNFLGLFARSPFGPLAQHAERAHDCVELLADVTEAFMAAEWDRTRDL